LGLALGPHELAAKFGEFGRLAFFPNDELVPEHIFPALEFSPDVAVGQLEITRGRRDGALLVDGLQQVH